MFFFWIDKKKNYFSEKKSLSFLSFGLVRNGFVWKIFYNESLNKKLNFRKANSSKKFRMELSEIIKSYGFLLEKRGNHLISLCPFHEEKNASFFINDKKGVYHCFGCGASGNIFSFLQNIKKKPPQNGKQFHAPESGILEFYLPKQNRKLKFNDTKIYFSLSSFGDLLLVSLGEKYFSLLLEKYDEAKIMTQLRGISFISSKIYNLGYASPQKNGLSNHFLKSGFSPKKTIRSGMVFYKKKKFFQQNQIKYETKWKNYCFFDMFRERLIIPIQNSKGITIGFGGRIIPKHKLPKYLNSKENQIFRKGKNLFSETTTIVSFSKKPKITLIVEGYMDSIILFQNGIRFSVASLGTSFDFFQLRSLKKINTCNHAIFCFDFDSSGEKANLNLFRKLKNQIKLYEVIISITKLPKTHRYKDPDEFSYFEGTCLFIKQIVNNSSPFLSWFENFLFVEFSNSISFLDYFFFDFNFILDCNNMLKKKEGGYQKLFPCLLYFYFPNQSFFFVTLLKIYTGQFQNRMYENKKSVYLERQFLVKQKKTEKRSKFLSIQRIDIKLIEKNILFFSTIFPKIKDEVISIFLGNNLYFLDYSKMIIQKKMSFSIIESKNYLKNNYFIEEIKMENEYTLDDINKETIEILLKTLILPERSIFLNFEGKNDLVLYRATHFFFFKFIEDYYNIIEKIKKIDFLYEKLEKKILKRNKFFLEKSVLGNSILTKLKTTELLKSYLSILKKNKN